MRLHCSSKFQSKVDNIMLSYHCWIESADGTHCTIYTIQCEGLGTKLNLHTISCLRFACISRCFPYRFLTSKTMIVKCLHQGGSVSLTTNFLAASTVYCQELWLASSPGSPPPLCFIRVILFMRNYYSHKGGGEPGQLWSRADTDDTFNVHGVHICESKRTRKKPGSACS